MNARKTRWPTALTTTAEIARASVAEIINLTLGVIKSLSLRGWLIVCLMASAQSIVAVVGMLGGVPVEVVFVGSVLLGAGSAVVGYAHTKRPGPRVVRSAPGSVLVRIAPFIFPRRVRERVLDQVIADMRLEYLEALLAGEIWLSRWIWARGHLIFWTAVLSYLGVSVVNIIKKVWVASR